MSTSGGSPDSLEPDKLQNREDKSPKRGTRPRQVRVPPRDARPPMFHTPSSGCRVEREPGSRFNVMLAVSSAAPRVQSFSPVFNPSGLPRFLSGLVPSHLAPQIYHWLPRMSGGRSRGPRGSTPCARARSTTRRHRSSRTPDKGPPFSSRSRR